MFFLVKSRWTQMRLIRQSKQNFSICVEIKVSTAYCHEIKVSTVYCHEDNSVSVFAQYVFTLSKRICENWRIERRLYQKSPVSSALKLQACSKPHKWQTWFVKRGVRSSERSKDLMTLRWHLTGLLHTPALKRNVFFASEADCVQCLAKCVWRCQPRTLRHISKVVVKFQCNHQHHDA